MYIYILYIYIYILGARFEIDGSMSKDPAAPRCRHCRFYQTVIFSFFVAFFVHFFRFHHNGKNSQNRSLE